MRLNVSTRSGNVRVEAEPGIELRVEGALWGRGWVSAISFSDEEVHMARNVEWRVYECPPLDWWNGWRVKKARECV